MRVMNRAQALVYDVFVASIIRSLFGLLFNVSSKWLFLGSRR